MQTKISMDTGLRICLFSATTMLSMRTPFSSRAAVSTHLLVPGPLSICTDKANPFHVPVHRPTFFATGLPFVMPPPLSCNNLYSDPPPARICSTHHLAAPQPSTQMHLQLRDNKLDTLVTVWHTSKAFPAHRGSGVTLISRSTSPCFSYFQSTQT